MKTYIMTTERTLREQIGEILEDEVRLLFPEGLYFAGGDETECLRIKKDRLIWPQWAFSDTTSDAGAKLKR